MKNTRLCLPLQTASLTGLAIVGTSLDVYFDGIGIAVSMRKLYGQIGRCSGQTAVFVSVQLSVFFAGTILLSGEIFR